MLKAIVYTSNTGTTAEYAELLSHRLSIPAYTLKAAETALPQGSPILYLGWLMASHVQGYRAAARLFDIQAVIGVGIGASGTQLAEVRKQNALPGALPLFTLRGGFRPEKLRGLHRLMMGMLRRSTVKTLSVKSARTADETALLSLFRDGGFKPDAAALDAICAALTE